MAFAARLLGLWPTVSRELARWEVVARAIPDDAIRHQALASLATKRFHCLGGAAYALEVPRGEMSAMIRWIVALQTISDFLDNLCDRTGARSMDDLRSLHDAFLDAVTPFATSSTGHGADRVDEVATDYYRHHPRSESGYLSSLVATCRENLSSLSGYPSIQGRCRKLASLYVDLQVFKHAPEQRVALLEAWFAREWRSQPDLAWWEFAAASGSTLALFALAGCAANHPSGVPEPVARQLEQAYFPSLAGLHILMDYGIDEEEDVAGGDLNFVAHYPDRDAAAKGILRLYREARMQADALPGRVHRTVADGLLGFYLSDPKARGADLAPWANRLLADASGPARALWRCCRVARLAGALR